MWPKPEYQMDFARPLFAWQRLRWFGLVLVLILLSLVLWSYAKEAEQAEYLQTLTQRQQQLTEQLAVMHSGYLAEQAASHVASETAAALNPAQQKAAQAIVQQLKVRWFELLQALEASQVPEIALLQLTPDANRGQFVLSGEAKDYASLLNYVRHLQEPSALYEVHLQKHQVNDNHPQHPVSFEIQGGWQP